MWKGKEVSVFVKRFSCVLIDFGSISVEFSVPMLLRTACVAPSDAEAERADPFEELEDLNGLFLRNPNLGFLILLEEESDTEITAEDRELVGKSSWKVFSNWFGWVPE
ncbi:unnamed protein product [[Candida] boidinii]|nr:unnamed protein product [[Candida] boidinii]